MAAPANAVANAGERPMRRPAGDAIDAPVSVASDGVHGYGLGSMTPISTPGYGCDDDPSAPFARIVGDPSAGLVLLCDHASNRVPEELDDLGLARADLDRHIAYDPGAAAVTCALAERIAAPAVLSTFSRLVIDPNRGEDDPTLVMRLSDGVVIPGNRRVDSVEKQRRIARFYRPYHLAIASEIDDRLAGGVVPALVSVHSFTPVWRGRPRRWQAGVLWDCDSRLAVPLIAALAADPALDVGDNEPYTGALLGDTLYRHGTCRGLAHALIELRQDLIADKAGVEAWADRLAAILADLDRCGAIHEIRYHGSRTGPIDPICGQTRERRRPP
jgi:predicted N-formylglutamate amidohydrolase